MNCRCCGNDNLKLLIDLGIQPVAHNLLIDEKEKDKLVHPLILHYCDKCGFIQINAPIPPEKLYMDYNYCFSGWKNQPHIMDEINLFSKHFKKDVSILEIGCNDGVFLKPLYNAGYTNIVGIEPNSYASNQNGDDYCVINDMFDVETSQYIADNYGKFDVVLLRQVLEHIADLDSFFNALKNVISPSGCLFLELPNFDEALTSGDCSTIWEEHPNYFTIDTLNYLLSCHNYEICDNGKYDFSGGALWVLAQQHTSNRPENVYPIEEAKYINFRGKVNQYKELFVETFSTYCRAYKVYLYGTGSRACTLVNGLKIGKYIDIAIDDQKEKQGMYMPGSRLCIESSDVLKNAGKVIVLLAVNHENEKKVKEKISEINNSAIAVSLFSPNNIYEELEKLKDISD